MALQELEHRHGAAAQRVQCDFFDQGNRGRADEAVWQDVCKDLLPQIRRMTNMVLRRFSYTERVGGFGEDIVQDIFCWLLERDRAVLRQIIQMESDSARAFLYTLIRRRVIDRARRLNAGCRQGDQTAVQMQSANGTPAGEESNPERRFMIREARRHLRWALEKVASGRHAEREQRIFELAVLDGWASPAIAAAVQPKMSSGAVDVAVSRTRKKLEERYFGEIGLLMRRTR